jgi:thiamine biosynthesis protein ThiI
VSEVILVRFGEIWLKGGNRSFFDRKLKDALKAAAATVPGSRIEAVHGRFLAWPPEGETRKLARAVERVFGVSSISPARVVEREFAAIAAAAVELTRAEVARMGGKPTFKVESRRADKRFPKNSLELSRDVGAAIVDALALPVDVHTPALQVGVEIGWEHAFVFAETRPGPGGLPVGASGRVELLLSGGIDSPVAGWLMMKRGCTLGATYFHAFPYTGDKSKEKVIALAKQLASWQQAELPLTVVQFAETQKALREASGDGRLAVVLYRRMMMRIAERIARASNAKGLVTGEALAQVASQTLDNLAAIGEAATLPVLRPCLAHDKQETIAIARRIGTYETSIQPYDDCCALFVPEHPETRAKLELVRACEARVEIERLAEACAGAAERIAVAP